MRSESSNFTLSKRSRSRLLLLSVLFGLFATIFSAWISALASPIVGNIHLDMRPGPWIESVPGDWPDVATGVAYVARKLDNTPYSLRPLGKQSPISNKPPRSARLRVRQGFASGVSNGPNGNTFFGDDPLYILDQVRYGWPINSMVSLGPDDTRPKSENQLVQIYRSGIVVSGDGTALMRSIPLKPRMIPFLLSTVFWSGVAWVIWLLYRFTGHSKRRRWRNAGWCAGCGYEIESLEICPECGAQR